MTDLSVQYKGVDVPSEYHTNLDSPGFAHWSRGVDAAQDQNPPETASGYEYFSDEDAEPYTYFRRVRPGQQCGQALFGRGRKWENDEIPREQFECDYGYTSIRFEDMPEWARIAPERD